VKGVKYAEHISKSWELIRKYQTYTKAKREGSATSPAGGGIHNI